METEATQLHNGNDERIPGSRNRSLDLKPPRRDVVRSEVRAGAKRPYSCGFSPITRTGRLLFSATISFSPWSCARAGGVAYPRPRAAGGARPLGPDGGVPATRLDFHVRGAAHAGRHRPAPARPRSSPRHPARRRDAGAARARKSATGARAAAQVAPTGPAPTAASQSIDDLERLVALHDSGQLSDTGVDSSRARSRCGVSSAELGRPSGGGVHTAPRTPDGTLADAGLRWDDRRAPARRGADARDHDPATSLQRRP
jgi:hypothetical protein